MKNTIYIILTLFAAIAIPMLTSWLYEWQFISDWWPRIFLVVVAMIIEIVVCGFMIWVFVQRLKK